MESRGSASRIPWWLQLLVLAGHLGAFVQLIWTMAASPYARGDEVTQCGQHLDGGLLIGLTAAVVVAALASLALAIARRPRLVVVALAAEALLATLWWSADSAGGGTGCVIG
jgi:cobalamin synthase